MVRVPIIKGEPLSTVRTSGVNRLTYDSSSAADCAILNGEFEPSEQCLESWEVTLYLRAEGLGPDRLRHLEGCDFCQTLVWRPAGTKNVT
jgi:hypothetical protein